MPTSIWWKPIAGIPIVAVLWMIPAELAPPDVLVSSTVAAPFVIASLALALLAPYCVYRERQAFAETGVWRPSRWYYTMIVPPFSLPISLVYLGQRYRYVGLD